MNAYDTMREACDEAKATMSAADDCASTLATILSGRLRKVPAWKLKRLKRELSQFNAATGKWKEEA